VATSHGDAAHAAGPYGPSSPTRRLLDRVADKWALLVLGTLERGPRRFSELETAASGVTPKVLTETLRALERDGLIGRRAYPERPARVEYALTDLGETLCPVMHMLQDWAEANIDRVLSARARYDTADDGRGSV
jgi:DNA-binding HxlR family transcriptional regulator